MKKPDFFIVGSPKCGTTALSEYLRSNPRIFMSFPKEPNHFCSDMPRRHGIKSFQKYEALFEGADNSHQAVGEASVHYLRSHVAIPRVAELYPDARYIVMVREPVAFLRSWHNQLIYSLSETEKDFAKAWHLQETRSAGSGIDAYILNYESAARFGEQTQRMLRNVNRNQVLFLKFEDFIADTRSHYLQVLEFLNVDDDGQTNFIRHNTAHQSKSRLVSMATRTAYNALSRINPLPRGNLIRTRAKRMLEWAVKQNTTQDRPQNLQKELANEIREVLRDDMELFFSQTGMSLLP